MSMHGNIYMPQDCHNIENLLQLHGSYIYKERTITSYRWCIWQHEMTYILLHGFTYGNIQLKDQ